MLVWWARWRGGRSGVDVYIAFLLDVTLILCKFRSGSVEGSHGKCVSAMLSCAKCVPAAFAPGFEACHSYILEQYLVQLRQHCEHVEACARSEVDDSSGARGCSDATNNS